jgi:hypothetical protein
VQRLQQQQALQAALAMMHMWALQKLWLLQLQLLQASTAAAAAYVEVAQLTSPRCSCMQLLWLQPAAVTRLWPK